MVTCLLRTAVLLCLPVGVIGRGEDLEREPPGARGPQIDERASPRVGTVVIDDLHADQQLL
jgi:hypothetical protein